MIKHDFKFHLYAFMLAPCYIPITIIIIIITIIIIIIIIIIITTIVYLSIH